MNSVTISMIIGVVEVALAFVIFQRAVPALLKEKTFTVWKTWLLGVALGLIGTGIVSHGDPVLSVLGHAALIAYAIMRLHHITGGRPPSQWWRED